MRGRAPTGREAREPLPAASAFLTALALAGGACAPPPVGTDTESSATSDATTSAGTLSTTTSTTDASTTDEPSTSTSGDTSVDTAGTDPTTGTGTTTSTTTSGSSGDATTTEDSTTSDTDGTGGGLPPECEGYVGQVTPEEAALTPQGDDEAEGLAIEASGEIVAPVQLTKRIAGDLAALRAANPEIAGIDALLSPAKHYFYVRFTPAAIAQIKNDTYHAWDCPNALYGATVKQIVGDVFVALTVDGLYDLEQVAADYLALDEVVKTSPLWELDGSDVCAAIAGEAMLYIFDDGYGDCQDGCIAHVYTGFLVDAEGDATALGTYATEQDMNAPMWFTDAGECTQWL